MGKTAVAIRERPTLMTGESVRAILDDRKTQTRRAVTKYNSICGVGKVDWSKFDFEGKSVHISKCFEPNCRHQHKHKAPLPWKDGQAKRYHEYLHVPFNWAEDMTVFRVYPRYEVGDRLWVRETWFAESQYDHLKPSQVPITSLIGYMATDKKPDWAGKTRPAIFMPRWASRILLAIVEVRAERLQEISEEDAKAEGVLGIASRQPYPRQFRDSFVVLWDILNAKRRYGWKINPFVWATSFRIVK